MYKKLNKVEFPNPTGIFVNMMPIVFGDLISYPKQIRPYEKMITQCKFRQGSIVYLSIHESYVPAGQSQRREGIHTEGTNGLGWGGGTWGGKGDKKGLYMASSDGSCRVWNCVDLSGDAMGAVNAPNAESVQTAPETLYWLTDRTPHEALPVEQDGLRQWFRLVSDEIGGWWEQHSTANPLGVQPDCPILLGNKFK